jgi:hypothetical protein
MQEDVIRLKDNAFSKLAFLLSLLTWTNQLINFRIDGNVISINIIETMF